MSAHQKLSLQIWVTFKQSISAQNLIGVSYEHLLNLNMKVGFGLLNEHEVNGLDAVYCFRGGSPSFSQPLVSETH